MLGIFVGRNSWFYVIAALTLPFMFLWPVQVALGSFALLVPFDSVSALGSASSGMTLTFVAGGATMLVFVLLALINRLTVPPRAAMWWALFVGYGLLSTAWAMDSSTAWARVPTAVALALLYIVATSVRLTSRELGAVTAMTMLGGVTAALVAILQFYSGVFYEDSMRGSLILGSRQADPNFFAATLLLPFSLAFGQVLSSRRLLKKAGLTTAVLVIGFGIFVTMSRGGIIALGVMMAVYLYRLRTNWRILLPVCLLLLLLAAVPELFFARFHEVGTARSAARMDFWIVGFAAFWHHWMLGVGLSNFPAAYDAYVQYAPSFHEFHRMAHNVYLSVLVESGIVGFFLFAGALWSQLRSLWRPENRTVATLLPYQAAFCAVLVSGLFLDILWTKSFWLVLILITLAERASQKQFHSQGQMAGCEPYS
jgi:O-antigen ligase